jgi:membrane fusion protein, multidrug efflux system
LRKNIGRIIQLIVFLAIAGAIAWWYFSVTPSESARSTAPERSLSTPAPVAIVKTAEVQSGALTEDISVYGQIIPAPGAVHTVSVPYECKVLKIMVNSGQKISLKDPLLEIEPSPDSQLKLRQARNIVRLTRERYQHVQELFKLQLATNAQMLQAEQDFRQAELEVNSLTVRGIDGQTTLTPDVAGLIDTVHVQEGAIVPAGDSLMDIVAGNLMEARLGVEAEDIDKIRLRQPVAISYVNVPGTRTFHGRIRQISRSVSSVTRLVSVFVTIPATADFLLGEYVQGQITIASSQGIIVPRSAVLPKDGRYHLFSIQNNRAVEHVVSIGLENQQNIEVLDSGLHPGDQVVILGNYELKDGMAVNVEVFQ